MQKILILAMIASFSFSGQAQTKPEPDITIVKEVPNTVYEGSSEHNRMNKTYEATLMPIGSGPGPGFSSGFNLGYRLDRNSSVVWSISKFTAGISCSGTLSCTTNTQTSSLYYKKFANNSFYYSAGLDIKRVQYEEQDIYKFGFTGESIGAGFVIGNQWQWENFTLGCDWVGASVPLITQFSNEYLENGAIQRQIDDKEQAYIKDVAPIALRFYVGASF